MKTRGENKKQLILITSSIVLGLGMSACSTTAKVKTSASNPAPITYKLGNSELPSQQYASVNAPTSMSYSAPKPLLPAAPAPMPYVAPKPHYSPNTFNQANVDRDLYMHQKVGRPYKIKGKTYRPKHNPDYDEQGVASWYGPNFHGKLTANGETYDQKGLTAAHKTLPLNSNVFVTNLETGQTITVRLNDRGPYVSGRIIDLSEGAAKALGIKGLGKVRVQYAGPADLKGKGFAKVEPKSAPVAKAAPNLRQIPAPKAEAQAPIAPAPQMAAKAPNAYQPLSVVPRGQFKPQAVALPTPQRAAPSAPKLNYVAPNTPYQPKADGKTRPRQIFTPPADGGVMTMTITGPIHMASAQVKRPTRKSKSEQTGLHYVQAATFSSSARAQSVRNTLSAAGPVTIQEIKRGERVLHKVLVGPYDSDKSAANALSLVATLGYSDAKLTIVH